jgi:NAD(P)-dependent dehydrogenase (short-subunit alcohol dehydrogenase family)
MNFFEGDNSQSGSFRDLYNLRGKVAIVTGGAGLLGRQFVEGLAEFGADLAILDIRTKEVENLAEQIHRKYGVKVETYSCDVTNELQVVNTIQSILGKYEKIDILISNVAGKSSNLDEFFMNFEDYSLSEWKKIVDVNLNGMFLVAREVGKVMVKLNTRGSIIQVSSIYGLVAPDQRIYEGSQYLGRPINSPAVYSASKSAVNGLSRYLASYWGSNCIRVNTLTPGGVFSGQNEKFVDQYSHRVPLARMAHSYEIASAAIFLASDASSYITGQNLVVDGGLSCW